MLLNERITVIANMEYLAAKLRNGRLDARQEEIISFLLAKAHWRPAEIDQPPTYFPNRGEVPGPFV